MIEKIKTSLIDHLNCKTNQVGTLVWWRSSRRPRAVQIRTLSWGGKKNRKEKNQKKEKSKKNQKEENPKKNKKRNPKKKVKKKKKNQKNQKEKKKKKLEKNEEGKNEKEEPCIGVEGLLDKNWCFGSWPYSWFSEMCKEGQL